MSDKRVFFSQSELDVLIGSDQATLEGTQLSLTSEYLRYELVEAVLVDAEQTDTDDLAKLMGMTVTLEEITARGGEVLVDSMIYEDAAYSVVSGFIGVPVEHASAGAPAEPASPDVAPPSAEVPLADVAPESEAVPVSLADFLTDGLD